jgi:peptidoglycan glycosyltransferase
VKAPPTVAQRRRRFLTRALPLALVALVAFVFGAIVGAPGSEEKETAQRFADAWTAFDYASMYAELDEESRRRVPRGQFAQIYREAAEVATLRKLSAGPAADPEGDGDTRAVRVPFEAGTAAFGDVFADLTVPVSEGGVAWEASLVFPGLRRGERLENRVALAPRAAILAADGTPLAEGPASEREHPRGSAAIDVTGEVGSAAEDELPALARHGFPPETPVGVSGLERAFNARLAGAPGGSLLAVAGEGGGARILSQSEARPGAPVKTTIDPDLQVATVAALGGRFGGVAVLDARDGNVRAHAGQAFSAPQPPGSTFKLVTTTAALQTGVLSLDEEYPIVDGANVGGRFISNANGELCGGTFPQAFAHSCNAYFAPLGPEIGNDEFVAVAERFGFNSPPTLYASRIVAEVEPEESTIPEQIGEDVDLGVTAIGQGEVLATPLEMASVAQTIANGGVRSPTSIVTNPKLRPEAKPVRVMSRNLAAELTDLMVGVVVEGTGFAGAIPEAQVAGKTGTAELGPKPGSQGEEEAEQIKDAWFTAFAPANKPRLAVGVMLIEAEAAGGEVAAPIASQVLSAGI